VLDGDQAPIPTKGVEPGGGAKGRTPQFSVHVYCNQTAEWIKVALGMEVGLGSGRIVLDGDLGPLPPKKRGRAHPNFRPIFVVAKRWMHQDATWYGGMPQPMRLCVRWGPTPLPKKGRAPQFSAHVYCG